MTKAQKLAAEMSDQLIAKIAVNPLLNAPGHKLDPAVLFATTKPGQTRISVINFSGLPADASRQDFANQLQMALFTFIRESPSKTPRLYVLDEAQNFAPSQGSTASKASAKALAAQARKFGLGMIFATQAPRGIDTNIVSNCLTHFLRPHEFASANQLNKRNDGGAWKGGAGPGRFDNGNILLFNRAYEPACEAKNAFVPDLSSAKPGYNRGDSQAGAAL